jgi:predicted secreted protein
MEEDYTKTLQDLCKKVDQISDSSDTQTAGVVVPGTKSTFPSFLNMQVMLMAMVPVAIAIIFALWQPGFITYEDEKSSETGEAKMRLSYIRLFVVTIVLSAVCFTVLFVMKRRRQTASITETTPEMSVPDKNAL